MFGWNGRSNASDHLTKLNSVWSMVSLELLSWGNGVALQRTPNELLVGRTSPIGPKLGMAGASFLTLTSALFAEDLAAEFRAV